MYCEPKAGSSLEGITEIFSWPDLSSPYIL